MSFDNKKILIIGAGELQIPIIKAAKKLGLIVIASDRSENAPGFEFADHFIIADTMNFQETIQKIHEYIDTHGAIHGVATAGTDASYTVAKIAEKFKLPGHSVESALLASDKYLMREALAKANIPIPKFKKISSLKEAEEFFSLSQMSCVLKPINSMGARGVSLVNKNEQLEAAFQLALEYSTTQECLIEEYIDAHELSIDALISNGILTITGIADRIIEYAPYFVETGHILPSNLPQEWIDRAIITFRDGIKALGLNHGAAKIDLKISKDHTWIIELAARLSGGFMSSHTFPYATGIPLQEYMVKLALGESLETIVPSKNWVSVERAIMPPPGIITNIQIPKNILEYPYISHFSLRVKVGDEIISPKNNLDKAGNIIASAPTREEAIRAINKAIYDIKIITQSHNSDILTQSYQNAKELLKGICNVCLECNGVWCKGKVPGVGGVGSGEGFMNSYQSYHHINLIPNYIHHPQEIDTSINIFGLTLRLPVLVAPIAGAKSNYGNCISELELQRAFLKGAYQAGTIGFSPDPIHEETFPYICQSILENYGYSVLIAKPRENIENIKKRIHWTYQVGAIGIGTDIDGMGLKTFKSAGQSTNSKTISELQELNSLYSIPFVIKGILSVQDAKNAVKAGITHIIVSSHGGRIHDSFPNPIDMLPTIREAIGEEITILIDGGIRSGADIAKAIILGADGVLIGRPIAIHAIGGGYLAVTAYLNDLQEQLSTIMKLLGVSCIDELKGKKDLIINKYF